MPVSDIRLARALSIAVCFVMISLCFASLVPIVKASRADYYMLVENQSGKDVNAEVYINGVRAGGQYLRNYDSMDVYWYWQKGTYNVEVRADGKRYLRTITFTGYDEFIWPTSTMDLIITINGGGAPINPPNKAPTADAGAAKTVTVNTTVDFAGTGTDTDGNVVKYDWDFGDGKAHFTDTGSGVTSHVYTTAGTYTATLTVTDDDGATGKDTVTITVTNPPAPPENHPPEITTLDDKTVFVGDELVLVVSAADQDGDSITFSSDTPWFAINETSGLVRFTPASSHRGDHTITITASDGKNSTTASFSLSVPNRAPSIGAIGNETAYSGALYTLWVSATDPDGDTLVFSTDSTILTINETGFIQFTPSADDVGIHQINVTVSDGINETTSSFALEVPNRVPTIADIQSPQLAYPGSDFSYQTFASDPDGGALSYELDNTSILSINDAGLISGTLTASDVGNHTITVTVNDSHSSASASFVLSVQQSSNSPPIISSISGKQGNVGVLFSLKVNATDADNDPLAYSVNLGSISGDGWFNFTPAASGNCNITVTVNDSKAHARMTFALSVSSSDGLGGFGQQPGGGFSVYRANSTTLSVNLPFPKEIGRNLTFQWRYKLPGASSWNATVTGNLLQNTSWDETNGTWRVTYTAARSAKLGTYGIAFSAQYSNIINVPTIYNSDVLEVENNVPMASSVIVSIRNITAGNNTNMSILARDIEDMQSQLSFEAQYRPSSGGSWSAIHINGSALSFQFGAGLDVGNYSIRARVTDRDGAASEWAYNNMTVLRQVSAPAAASNTTTYRGAAGGLNVFDSSAVTAPLAFAIAMLAATAVAVILVLRKTQLSD